MADSSARKSPHRGDGGADGSSALGFPPRSDSLTRATPIRLMQTEISLMVLKDSVLRNAPMASVKNPDSDARMVELATVV